MRKLVFGIFAIFMLAVGTQTISHFSSEEVKVAGITQKLGNGKDVIEEDYGDENWEDITLLSLEDSI